MTILDTSIVIDLVRERKPVNANITIVTLVEYPRIVYYRGFSGNIIFPKKRDYILAHTLQLKLMEHGKSQQFSDLLIAAIAIRRRETVVTRDRDFKTIQEAASSLGHRLELKLAEQPQEHT